MKKKILVAPLNWGLGHATRCIPIIKALIANNFEPILASDGVALDLLKKEFPDVICLELPSYSIKYSRKGYFFKLKLLKDSPKVINAIQEEKKTTKHIVETHQIQGIISDNRLGVYHKDIPSVFVTHQLQVLSGNTTWLSTKMHQKIINRFNECWVPDTIGTTNLSGKLGHVTPSPKNIKYIGPLSRFKQRDVELTYDVMVLLSGPEPQRSMLEEKLLLQLEAYKGRIIFVKGIVEQDQSRIEKGSVTIYNFLMGEELEIALNASKIVLSRSGYTTIMDLAKLGKKAFFIPTPGQFEQEYLATRLSEQGFVPCCNQNEFDLDKLKEVDNYLGLEAFDYEINFKKLFNLFKSE